MSHAYKTALAFACVSTVLSGCADMDDAGAVPGAQTYNAALYYSQADSPNLQAQIKADPSLKLVRSVSKPIGQTGSVAISAGISEMVEIDVTAAQGAATTTVCYAKADGWEGPQCLAEQKAENGTITIRHVPAEAQTVTVHVLSTGAPEGSFTIKTRGDQNSKGAEALAKLERMNGKAYIFPVTVDGLIAQGTVRYKTDVPGQRATMWTEAEDGSLSERTLELDPTGGLIWKQGKETGPARLAEDGTVYLYFKNNRLGYAVSEDGVVKKIVDNKIAQDGKSQAISAGVFKRVDLLTEQPADQARITAMMKGGPGRIAAARMKRVADWGTFAQMAGRHWTFFAGGNERIGLYQWTIPDQQMVARYWNADAYNIGKPDPEMIMTHNATTGAIDVLYVRPSGARSQSVITRGPQGESIETTGQRKDIYSLTNANEVAVRNEMPAGQQPSPLQTRRAMDNAMVQVAIERTQAAQQRIAQQQAAARAAEEEDDDVDLLGFLNTAQQAYGLANNKSAYAGALGNAFSPEVGSILQGAANSNAGSASGALAAGINQTFQQSLNQAVPGIAPGGGGTNMASLGSGGAANIKNFAMGPQCPGFTNENYRQHAFNGGNDQQLFSLCGEAFELFHMTQNAISQGYSEADWNRTYTAHKDSARVATDFYNKNRAK